MKSHPSYTWRSQVLDKFDTIQEDVERAATLCTSAADGTYVAAYVSQTLESIWQLIGSLSALCLTHWTGGPDSPLQPATSTPRGDRGAAAPQAHDVGREKAQHGSLDKKMEPWYPPSQAHSTLDEAEWESLLEEPDERYASDAHDAGCEDAEVQGW